jgi:hypothetical protein
LVCQNLFITLSPFYYCSIFTQKIFINYHKVELVQGNHRPHYLKILHLFYYSNRFIMQILLPYHPFQRMWHALLIMCELVNLGSFCQFFTKCWVHIIVACNRMEQNPNGHLLLVVEYSHNSSSIILLPLFSLPDQLVELTFDISPFFPSIAPMHLQLCSPHDWVYSPFMSLQSLIIQRKWFDVKHSNSNY